MYSGNCGVFVLHDGVVSACRREVPGEEVLHLCDAGNMGAGLGVGVVGGSGRGRRCGGSGRGRAVRRRTAAGFVGDAFDRAALRGSAFGIVFV